VLNPAAELGRTYWAFVAQSTGLTAVGRLPGSEAAGGIRLRQGWNLVGLPRPGAAVQWFDCQVLAGARPAASLLDTDSLVAPCLWRWRPESTEYVAE